MSLDASSFFGSPTRDSSKTSDGAAFGVDRFFEDGPPLAPDIRDTKDGDELTDVTSSNTRATTPALSEGWVVEDKDTQGENCLPEDNSAPSPREPSPVEQESTRRPSIMARNYDGKLIIIRRRPKKNHQTDGASISRGKDAISKLIDIPLHRIMEQLASDTAKRLDINDEEAVRKGTSRSTKVEELLWTDKYKPRYFTDLLGDERVHRDTMSWVKEWDACVFPEKVGRRKRPVREGEEESTYQDEYRRPREKILLLSGPPGLGKTTLAHVVARQAGYTVMEINASDTRAGSTIEDRIRPVLEAGSRVGGNKPVLVVIDEIDGATGGGDNSVGFVQKLITLTMDKPKKKGRSKQTDGRRPLLRPIICICNDLYAASLAKLRPIAKIVRFQQPAPIHLVKRLKDICEMESLRADSRSLTTLVGITQGDMRGCLNTLQLLRAKHSEITELVVRRATVGMKESEGSLMSVVTDIFTPLSKSRVKDMGLTSEEEAKYVKRLSRAAESTGSVDRIALACFEHYLNYRIHDANFKAYEKAHTWLAAYETFNEGLWQDREYAIMPYLAYTLIPFHPIFSTKGGPKLERPKADWEAFQKQKTYEEIYRTISRSVMGDIGQSSGSKKASSYRHLVAKEVLPLEFAPLLNRIISPPLKPVNRQIIKPEEKVVVSRLVDIMVALDLRFVQEKQDDGVLVYRLEPPIDVFVTYDEKRAPDIAVTRYATRQLIASEIDARVIERQAEAFDETSKPKVASFFNRASVPEETELSPRKGAHEEEMASSPPSASRKLKTDEPSIDIADKPPVDFFGRLVTPKHSNTKGDTVHGTASKFKAAFKFNEGMSAAVRKPVKITSLLS